MLNVSAPALPTMFIHCPSSSARSKVSLYGVPWSAKTPLYGGVPPAFNGLAMSTMVSVPAEPLSTVARFAAPSITTVIPAFNSEYRND